MATVPDITNEDRIVDYSPDSATAEFVIPWTVIADSELLALDDLVVLIDGEEVDSSDFIFTGNVVTGLLGVWNGGTVTLDDPVTGVRVVIYSKRDPRRTGNFLEGRALPMTTLDKQLDDVALQARDMDLQIGQSLRAPLGEGVLDMTLPAISTLKGRLLQFDADTGLPTAGPTEAELITTIVNEIAGGSDAVTQAIEDFLASRMGGMVQSGIGPPSDTLGSNGDIYWDTDEVSIYPPKSAGTWGSLRYPLTDSSEEAALPTGAIGIWDMSDYSASPVKHIPNSAAAVAFSGNFLAAPSGLFNNVDFYSKSGLVITDRFATGPLGGTTASRLVGTGNWFIGPRVVQDLPDGTYVLPLSVRSNTGVSQDIRQKLGGTTVTRTVTTSWTRILVTATVSGGAIDSLLAWSKDGSTGCDILIDYAGIYTGSSDPGPDEIVGHLMLGRNAYSGDTISFGSNELVMTSNMGLIQFPEDQVMSSWTTQACLKANTVTTADILAWLSHVPNYQYWTAYAMYGLTPRPPVFSATYNTFNLAAGAATQRDGFFNLSGLGQHIITSRYDSATQTMQTFIDDEKLFTAYGAVTARTLRDLFFNAVVNSSLQGKGTYAGKMVLWDRALNDGEVRRAVLHQQQLLTARSVSYTLPRTIIVAGTSFENGFNYCWPYKLGPELSPLAIGDVFAVTGSRLSDIEAQLQLVIDAIPPDLAGRKFIYVIGGLMNGLGTEPGADDATAVAAVAARLFALGDAARALGVKVPICTTLPNSDAVHNTRRNLLNPILIAAVGSVGSPGKHFDAVIDFAADIHMGPDSAPLNATYYDGTGHPTDAGQEILKDTAEPVVNGF